MKTTKDDIIRALRRKTQSPVDEVRIFNETLSCEDRTKKREECIEMECWCNDNECICCYMDGNVWSCYGDDDTEPC